MLTSLVPVGHDGPAFKLLPVKSPEAYPHYTVEATVLITHTPEQTVTMMRRLAYEDPWVSQDVTEG